jgi:aryl carrier-like protein
LQAAVELLAVASGRPADAPWVLLSVEIAQMLSGAAPVWGYATVEGASHAELFGHVYFWDAAEKPAAEVHGLRLRAAPRGAFVPASPQTASLSAAPRIHRWVQTLREADPQLREQLLAAFLREQIASLLGPEAARDSPDRTGFFESGIDSLRLVELRNRLQHALGSTLELPMAVLFNYPTPEALAHYLVGEISSGPPSGAPGALAVEVAGLSEEALDRSLDAFDEWSRAEKV